jgi:hypothetical protein
MAEAQILRQLGYNWLECADEQGIFYFNSVTQQSSDIMPPELMGQMPQQMPQHQVMQQQQRPQQLMYQQMPPQQMLQQQMPQQQMPQPQMLQQQMFAQQMQMQQPMKAIGAKVIAGGLGGGQMQSASYTPPQFSQQPQPVTSYTPGMTPVTSYVPAPQQNSYTPQQNSYAPQQNSYTPVQQYKPAHQMTQPAPQQQFISAAPQMAPQPQPATQKMAFGDWAVYQDDLGTFYMQVSTGMQFETPPPELSQAYQVYRAEQDQLHMLELQRIEQQKQQIDQQLYQQTESLRYTYGAGQGIPA